ncbi:MAG TPA: DNA gyrase subunit A [Methylomusa anaerophila]|uniref:DNA gyrase subunit A n=1 Tax=Methylomusa anaerophila TaxID=1930071 RepID=A0A348AHK1_9FIRM|nr:DNA gyrase subunit A [Methylomusa anaerophila]BBB90549.1 DNA gyrase subunit A [Methylomusa anaerophila]HML88845.1 DNA gyrase subunit A [Methylomusa anaerophila]
MDFGLGKVMPIRLEEEMKHSYIDYAMSVIVMRALPDVRDGLKPVHRRILYAMHEAGMAANKPYKKSARIVGEVLGKYHPHGDSSVYDAIVRMAQNFSSRYMLVDGHGNFGSIDGDSAAAMRYTEVRMSRIAEEMLADIEKDTVDFGPNYDESLKEPLVLPAKIPNLLVNGSAGIAVGMATNIPPHNLGEVVDGLVMMIDNPAVTIQELMMAVKGPDFPTGGLILGREGIKQAYMTGRGGVKMRAQARIERMQNGKQRILVTEIPYQVNKARLIETIAALVRDKTVDGITDLRDESDRTGMRIVIELRRDVNPDIILNQLYKHTQMQETFGVNMLALVNGRPKVLNLHEVLQHYLAHQKEVIIRRTKFELDKARARAHILEGLKIALDHLDAVISTIRQSQTPEIAREALMAKFNLSEKQAQAILDMRLQRLTGLEREKIEMEYKDILETIEWLEGVLADEHKVMNIIKEELLDVKKRFADARRTVITSDISKLEMEDLIAEEDVVITLTHYGYIKRLPVDTYRSQRRGGRGVTGMGTKEEDFVEQLFVATTHHNLLFFTTRGRVYRLKAYEVPEAGRTAKGTAIVNLLQVEKDEKITAVIPVKEFVANRYLFMATQKGIVKKSELVEFDTARKGGLNAINLDDDDDLIGVKLTSGEQHIIMGTRDGKAIVFPETEVRVMGRTAHGVRGINLEAGDEVIGMDTAKKDGEVLTVTSEGYGKRTRIDEYRVTARGGKGVINIKPKAAEKIGHVVGIKVVIPGQELMLITSEGIIIRMEMDTISVTSRSTQGVKLMKTGENDKVVALAVVEKKADND